MNAPASDTLAEAVRKADVQIAQGVSTILEARRALAAAESKYRERLRGRPTKR